MQFSSLLFLLYFLPVVVILYQAMRFSSLAQNILLLLASLVFYSWGNLINTVILLVMIACNYGLGMWAKKPRNNSTSARWIFAAALAVNLGPLLFFNYLASLVGILEGILGQSYSLSHPAAPLGIAFIALQGISYVTDIYRGKAAAESNPVNCALFLSFFPTLFAGPILRYQDVAGQINYRKTTWQGLSSGVRRFLVGLGKYTVLAMPLSALADAVFNSSNISGIFTTTPISMALLGLVAFVLQVYYSLSGFSDMAIGLGRMFGFEYPENFNYPVLATSVSDFWNRSFRSLTVWFEEYVYGPLCTRSKNRDQQVLYHLIMWLLIGLWIGPTVPNLLFAFWNFAFLLVEMVTEFEDSRLANVWRRIYVVVTMVIGLVALRTDTIYEYALFMGNLIGANNNGFGAQIGLALLREFWPALVLGLLFLFPVIPKIEVAMSSDRKAVRVMAGALYIVGMVVLVLLIFASLIRNGRDASIISDFSVWSMYNG